LPCAVLGPVLYRRARAPSGLFCGDAMMLI
jgi:hypothetical protein